ncbi:MAG: polysaccharide biosynthesis protein [Fusobacterium sp. JB019]|nr:polysaccharide biosynthesis protein [Fusobacterium sp. JB019]
MIEVTGLRSGEKLYEELLYNKDKAKKTENNKIFITEIEENDLDIRYYLNQLKSSIKEDSKEKIRKVIYDMIKIYNEAEYN